MGNLLAWWHVINHKGDKSDDLGLREFHVCFLNPMSSHQRVWWTGWQDSMKKNMQYLGRYGIGMAYHFMFKPLDQPVPPNTNTTEWPSAPQSSSGSGLWPGRQGWSNGWACIQQGPADQSHQDGHHIHLCSPPGFEKSWFDGWVEKARVMVSTETFSFIFSGSTPKYHESSIMLDHCFIVEILCPNLFQHMWDWTSRQGSPTSLEELMYTWVRRISQPSPNSSYHQSPNTFCTKYIMCPYLNLPNTSLQAFPDGLLRIQNGWCTHHWVTNLQHHGPVEQVDQWTTYVFCT